MGLCISYPQRCQDVENSDNACKSMINESRNSIDESYKSRKSMNNEEERINILSEFLSFNIERKYVTKICQLCKTFFDATDCFVTFMYKTNKHFYTGSSQVKRNHTRDDSFCDKMFHTHENILVIDNFDSKEISLVNNYFINTYPNIQLYASVVLYLNNVKVGSLCIINDNKMDINEYMMKHLKYFASLVEKHINMAYSMHKMKHILQSNLPDNMLSNMLRRSKSSFDSSEPKLNFSSNTGICFIDIVNFSHKYKDAEEIAFTLHALISEFDILADKFNITKVRTIGDGYFACCGLDESSSTWDTNNYYETALSLLLFASSCINMSNIKYDIDLRIGLHIGECYYGVIGQNSIQFDLFGESINFTARLEQTCTINRIHISKHLYTIIKNVLHDEVNINIDKQYTEMKNMGNHTTYSLSTLSNEVTHELHKTIEK